MYIGVGFIDNKTKKGLLNATGSVLVYSGNILVDQFQVANGYVQIDNFSVQYNYVFKVNGYKDKTESGNVLYGGATSNDLGPSVFVYLEKLNDAPALLGLGLLGLLLLKKDKKKIGKLNPGDAKTALIIGGGVLGFIAIKKVFEKLGILQDQSTVTVNNIQSDSGSFWNGNYWQQFSSFPNSVLVNNSSSAGSLYAMIDNSFGIFVPNFDTIFGEFKLMKTKSDLSYFSYWIKTNQRKDIIAWLKEFDWTQTRLNDEEISQINDYFKTLPSN